MTARTSQAGATARLNELYTTQGAEQALHMRNGGEQLDVKTLLKMQEAVCKVKCLGGGAGSGSLCQVKDWLCILTNNHVLGTPSAAKNASAEFEDRNGNTVTVQLNPDIFFLTNGSLDFTFVGLREKCVKCAGSARSLQPLVLSRGKVSCGDAVHIVQFPRGGEKKFAIQAVKDTSGNKVWYLADTDYGSSGSPVFKAGEVVALHRARDPLRKANEGVLMSAILERLGEHLSQHVKEQQTQFAKSDSPRQQIVDLTMDTSSTGGALRPSSPLIPPETPPRTQQTTTSNSSRGALRSPSPTPPSRQTTTSNSSRGALRSPSPTPPSRQTTTDNSAHGGALRATWLRVLVSFVRTISSYGLWVLCFVHETLTFLLRWRTSLGGNERRVASCLIFVLLCAVYEFAMVSCHAVYEFAMTGSRFLLISACDFRFVLVLLIGIVLFSKDARMHIQRFWDTRFHLKMNEAIDRIRPSFVSLVRRCMDWAVQNRTRKLNASISLAPTTPTAKALPKTTVYTRSGRRRSIRS